MGTGEFGLLGQIAVHPVVEVTKEGQENATTHHQPMVVQIALHLKFQAKLVELKLALLVIIS